MKKTMAEPTATLIAHPLQKLLALLAILIAAAAVAPAGEEEDLYARTLRRYESVNAELQRALNEIDQPAPLRDYPARVLSLRKNAEITVGGEMRLNWIGAKSTFTTPDAGNPDGSRAHNSKTGDLTVATARLTLEARAAGRWRAFFDINLNGRHGRHDIARITNVTAPGASTPTYDRDNPIDNINAFYLEMLKDGHSGFGFKAGIMKMPFGLAGKKDLFPQSYMDAPDLAASYLAHPQSWDNAMRLPHASALLTPATALMLNYEMRDIIRFEGGVFQERDSRMYRNHASNGVYSTRSESALPQSWQVGASLLPLEGWELSTQFRNRHKRSRGIGYWADSPYRWDFAGNRASGGVDPAWDPNLGQWVDGGPGESFGSRSNEQALALGAAFELPNGRWSFFAEYAKGWNQGFNRHIRSEGVNLGAAYRLTPFLTLHGQAEWLQVKDGSWIVAGAGGGWSRDARTNRLCRVMFGLEYEVFAGLTLEGGWQYEHWNLVSNMGGAGGTRDERVDTANMVYLGTRFVF